MKNPNSYSPAWLAANRIIHEIQAKNLMQFVRTDHMKTDIAEFEKTINCMVGQIQRVIDGK